MIRCGKKNQRIIEQKLKAWNNWKLKNKRYFENQSKEKQQELENQHFIDQTIINQVFVDFDVWVEELPCQIDYTVGKWEIKRKNA